MKTILIVEDDKDQASILSHSLEKSYNIKVAFDGERGYEAYKKIKPDIIITDINLPKLNGIELVTKIRKKDNNTKIIMLTSHAEVDFLLAASGLKLTKYLLKPINIDIINETLELAQKEAQEFTVMNNTYVEISSDLSWNKDIKELVYQDQYIKLSIYEKIFIQTLIEAKGKVITYDDLLAIYWESNFQESTKNSIKTLVSKLRKKLPVNFIENIYATGYKYSIQE